MKWSEKPKPQQGETTAVRVAAFAGWAVMVAIGWRGLSEAMGLWRTLALVGLITVTMLWCCIPVRLRDVDRLARYLGRSLTQERKQR